MTIQEIEAEVEKLKELEALVEEANAQIGAIKDIIKNIKALKAEHPELVDEFRKTSSTTRFILS